MKYQQESSQLQLSAQRHLRDLGALSIEPIPSGLQGCIGPRYIIPLLMATHPHRLHGMEGTRICSFFY
jgi:hypothetical protein